MSNISNINNTDSRELPEEFKEYLRAMNTAYPGPKTDIHAAVMAKINAEKKKAPTGTKITRGLFVKWGSLAASIVLVAAVCLKILPSVGEIKTDSADNAEVYDQITLSCKATAIIDCDAMEQSLPTDENALAEAEENYSETSTEATDDESFKSMANGVLSDESSSGSSSNLLVMNNILDFKAPVRGPHPPTECEHSLSFMNSYHDIPVRIISLVGNKEYEKWLVTAHEIGYDNGCCKNIAAFIEYFDISREVFEEIYLSTDIYYFRDYPLELLFEGDADTVYEYYKNGGSFDKAAARYFEYKFKLGLIRLASVSVYNSWLTKTDFDSLADWSIAQFAHDMKLDEEALASVYGDVKSAFAKDYPDTSVPEYDFAAVAEYGEEIRNAVLQGALGHEIDALYRK